LAPRESTTKLLNPVGVDAHEGNPPGGTFDGSNAVELDGDAAWLGDFPA
jgi:hypothetical protein